ncbi:hypothetical protein O9G_003912 [Rozella allomycis CSF55]|uniref:Uncharacterized protein n=1 Tax=Rozella allomycis (strain CSF55) TaxID=988480 RepID=A0A075AXW1_ROZAC|nr:hypothetical protein O9G_003912 [Rozella allomycis CSF55]|eukprot:EPZ33409.1 hypothetical protein O9G_003912 [Rozella allomycis CSF55]
MQKCKLGEDVLLVDSYQVEYTSLRNWFSLDALISDSRSNLIASFINYILPEQKENWAIRELHCRLAEFIANKVHSDDAITDELFKSTINYFIQNILNMVTIMKQSKSGVEPLILGAPQVPLVESLEANKESTYLKKIPDDLVDYRRLMDWFQTMIITDDHFAAFTNYFDWLIKSGFIELNDGRTLFSKDMYVEWLYEFLVGLDYDEKQIKKLVINFEREIDSIINLDQNVSKFLNK